jgi:hypothetical protein
MDRPVWKEAACGASFRAAESGGEERPSLAHQAANPMLRPLAGRNPAPPACGVSWAGPLARLEVVFHFFCLVFSDLCRYFLLHFF